MAHLSLVSNRGQAGSQPSAPPDTARAAVRGLDAWLRRQQGFVEFACSADCILRVAVTRARNPVLLRDGALVRPGDPVIEIHFWNERLPQASASQGLGWGRRFGRRLTRSFGELAAAIETDPRLGAAVAVRGRLAFAGDRNTAEMRRFGHWFGFDEAEAARATTLAERLHDLGEDLWLLALAWTFNPGCLPSRALRRRRDDLWISRAQLLARHGAAATATASTVARRA